MSMTDLLDDNMPDFKFNEDIYIVVFSVLTYVYFVSYDN